MTTFDKTGIISSSISLIGKADLLGIDPDNWVESLFRIFEGFIKTKLDQDIYDIRFSFPSANDIGVFLPLDKTIIHFEMDNISNPMFGIGRNVVQTDVNADNKTIVEWEAIEHQLNFDVGVWASARSGGITARLRAFQRLSNLFCGSGAFFDLQKLGIEIMNFSGASFIKEEINEVSVFRITNMTLEMRVYSRRAYMTQTYIDDIEQNSQLTNPDNVLLS